MEKPGNNGQCRFNRLIGAASGWGAQRRETEDGPQAIFALNVPDFLNQDGIHCEWDTFLYPQQRYHEITLSNGLATLPMIVEHDQRLALRVHEALNRGEFPCVIGGDHSVAIGTWSGVTTSLGLQEHFGLIWIDAHMDAHTPKTSPSQAYHGMPVAALLGHGEKQLTEMILKGAKINPRDLVLLGIRSYEEEEALLLERLGVKIIAAEDVRIHGMDAMLSEAIDHVTQHTQGFGVSIDLDAFDPEDAPGVGSPEPMGIRAAQALEAFCQLSIHKDFRALEIVELNPKRDQNHKTSQLVLDLLTRVLPR